MGTWGTGILEDDLARDVYDRYTDARGSGRSDEEALREVLSEFRNDEQDPDEGPIVWLAIAHAQWDLDRVSDDVAARVRDIVANGLGLARWQEAGAGPLGRRKKALSRFVEQIQQPRRRKRRTAASGSNHLPFGVGDCLAIELEQGRFGAAIVTRINTSATASSCILSILRYYETAPPELSVFANPAWVVVTKTPEVTIVKYCCYGDGWARHGKRYRAVGRIEIPDVPPPLTLRIANWSSVWKDLGQELSKSPGFGLPSGDTDRLV